MKQDKKKMFIPTYEVSEETRRVEYWNSLLEEHNKKPKEEVDVKSDKLTQTTQDN